MKHVDVGSSVAARGPDADAKDDWTFLSSHGAWGPDNEEKADWNTLFGADARLYEVSQPSGSVLEFSVSFIEGPKDGWNDSINGAYALFRNRVCLLSRDRGGCI